MAASCSGSIHASGAQAVVTIEAYEPITCEYAHGPSFILSGEDIERFRKALRSTNSLDGQTAIHCSGNSIEATRVKG